MHMQALFDRRAIIITVLVHLCLCGIMLLLPDRCSKTFHITVQRPSAKCDTDVYFKSFSKPKSIVVSDQKKTVMQNTQITEKKKNIAPAVSKEPLKAKPVIEQKKPVEIAKKEKTAAIAQPAKINKQTAHVPIRMSSSLGWNAAGVNADRLERAVRNVIHKRWHPPIDVSKDLCATVRMYIDATSTVQACQFEQRSGLILFDQSIQQAVIGAVFPAHLKEVTIIIEFTA